jgi:tetratricopeptide (TPR) repeat protein
LFLCFERERSPAITTTVVNQTAAVLIAEAQAKYRTCRYHEAARLFERVLELDPASELAKFRLADICVSRPRTVEDVETALRLARELLQHKEAHVVAAMACFYLDRLDECQQHYATAIAMMPPNVPTPPWLRLCLATIRLWEGDLGVWSECADLLSQQPNRDATLPLRTPRWDGGPLLGRKIFLHALLDGFGDAMQFARYIPRVAAMDGHVTLLCAPELWSLFDKSQHHLGFHSLVRVGSNVPLEVAWHDVQAALKSLPGLFGTTRETIPATVPYLTADSRSIERWRPTLEALPGLRIGIAWRGNPGHFLDGLRSFDLGHLAQLAEIPGVSLVSLQKDHGADELARLGGRFRVIDLGAEYAAGDWAVTAAVVGQLDLIITPDTAIAHLAGALGKPVWVGLPRPSEWRWMRDGDDSPWYPTMRLFRQDRLDEWGPVFARMADRLREFERPRRADL